MNTVEEVNDILESIEMYVSESGMDMEYDFDYETYIQCAYDQVEDEYLFCPVAC